MMISLIAALAVNGVIGKKNVIPWHLPADLAWLKRNTLKKPVIMGRKTFESIGSQPLSSRLNIVLSHHRINIPGVIWAKTPMQALVAAGQAPETMVSGGGKVYKTFLEYSRRLYLTHINTEVSGGDTWFPYYKSYEWKPTWIEFHESDDINSYSYRFEILERC